MNKNLTVLNEQSSIVNSYLAELRDVEAQTDPLRFRRNLERLGEIAGYEISKQLAFRERVIVTPLGTTHVPVLAQQPVLATILRAGLPLHQGLLSVFDHADNAFVSAYRKHEGDEDSFEVEIEYLASPALDGRTVILSDPMLASGSSMILAWKAMLERGTPAFVHVVAIIASQQGVDALREFMPENSHLWVAAIDPELDHRAYIVPGLGDAGDLAYGSKI